jgi:predicted transposase YdaD
MLYEILKDTRAFRELAKEGLAEGLKEGLEKGREEGQLNGLRLAVLDIIEMRFADQELVELARSQVEAIEDEQTLRHLVGKVAMLQQPEELTSLFTPSVAKALARLASTKTTPAV